MVRTAGQASSGTREPEWAVREVDADTGSGKPRSLRLVGSYLLGWVFGCIHIHRSSRSNVAGRETVTKVRRRSAAVLVPLANLCLRWQGAGTCVLSRAAWKAREVAVNRMQPWREVGVCPTGITMPRWRGSTLDEYLAAEPTELERWKAIHAAWEALRELHGLTEPSGDNVSKGGFSHADATTRNVMYDCATGAAVWIDFDMCHETSRPVLWRQADDARAFLVSVARRIPAAECERVVKECLAGTPHGDLRRVLRTLVIQAAERPLSFHMAQHRLSPGQYREVIRRLLAGLEAADNPI